MTDVRAETSVPPFDEKTPTLDRRQLIRAGAWAAPAIVLATAAPAAANLSGKPVPPPSPVKTAAAPRSASCASR